MFNLDPDHTSAQPSIKCGDTSEAFYTPPSKIPPGVLSVLLNSLNVQAPNNKLPTDTTFVERTNPYNMNHTIICPRCGFTVFPVKSCGLNPVQPITVKKSKSKLRKFLPIILTALLNDESEGPSCCCRCSNHQASEF